MGVLEAASDGDPPHECTVATQARPPVYPVDRITPARYIEGKVADRER